MLSPEVLSPEVPSQAAVDASGRMPSPRTLCEYVPVPPSAAARVEQARRAVRDVLHGRDRERLLLVVGPCSIHDRAAALEYARRLAPLAVRHRERLIVIMRAYFEKPRTTIGWKGFIHDPDLDGSGAGGSGLERARSLLIEILEIGLPCATELLDPMISPYLEDLLSWAAIGARTSESQPHRELASGLSLPVGFKNATSGAVEVALNAIAAAQRSHSRFTLDPSGGLCMQRTAGNPDVHVVLRGGRSGPNHFPEVVQHAAKQGRALGLKRPVLVDCSHDNSGQDHRRQGAVCRAVLEQLATPAHGILGLQIESHLEAGRQEFSPGARLVPGLSITDACIGWDETAELIEEIAAAVGGR